MSSYSGFALDLADFTKDTPLSDVNARQQTRKRVRLSKTAPKNGQRIYVRGKGPVARAKKVNSTKGRQSTPESQASTTDVEPEHEEDHSEQTSRSVGHIYREGDPGFEAAYQASILERRRRQDIVQPQRQIPPRPAPRHSHGVAYHDRPRQYVPDSPPTRRIPQDDVSDSEILGYSEDRTLVAPDARSNAFPAPRVPARPRDPANSPTPPPRRRRRNPMTGLPFEPLNRRPEALSGYSDTPVRRRGSSIRSSRVAPSTSVHTPEDNHGPTGTTRNPNTEFSVDPANRPPQNYYDRSPGGSYYHDEEVSETPTSVTNPGPSSSSGMGFTQDRPAHGRTQSNGQPGQPPDPSRYAQLVDLSPLIGSINYATDTDTSTRQVTQQPDTVNDHTNQGDLAPNQRVSRLSKAERRYENVLLAEARRARTLREMMRSGRPDYVTGSVEREDEGVRRKKPGSTDDDEGGQDN